MDDLRPNEVIALCNKPHPAKIRHPMPAPLPANETARLQALQSYQLLDTAAEQGFDDVVQVASFICGASTALMTLVDDRRQWFKAKVGVKTSETLRDEGFCAYTILGNELFIVEDALASQRSADHPLVVADPHIRFYAGAPLITPEGLGLGALCVIDREPRQLTPEQSRALEALARLVVTEVELRRVSATSPKRRLT